MPQAPRESWDGHRHDRAGPSARLVASHTDDRSPARGLSRARGEFLVATVGSEDPETGVKLQPANLHVPNDARAYNELLSAIEGATTERKGNNVYIGISLTKPGLDLYHKGTEADVIGVLAAVFDFDGKHDPETRHARLPLGAMADVEASTGNFQCWYFFDRPYPVADAKPVLTALARCTG